MATPLDFSSLVPSPDTPASPPPPAPEPAPAPASTGSDYGDLFAASGAKHSVDPFLLRAIADTESGTHHDRFAISSAGAEGVMQLMPDTARGLHVRDTFDPKENIDGGARYIKEQLDAFGNPYTAIAAYNAGPKGNFNDPGVQDYVTNVTNRWLDYKLNSGKPSAVDGKPAATPAAAPAGAPQRPLVLGDSIAVGLGGPGQVGASPQRIRDSIVGTPQVAGLPEDQVKGRDVVLSGGVSNNIGQVGLVEDQIRALQGKGANSVTLVGVGNRPDYVKADVNGQLAAIAEKTGAHFTGPIPPEMLDAQGVHPKDYHAFGATVMPKPAPAAPVPLTFDHLVPQQQQSATPAAAPLSFDSLIPKKPEDTGFSGAVWSGLKSAVRGGIQTAQALGGGQPKTQEDNIVAAQPITLGDALHPITLGQKMVYGLASSAPEIGAFIGASALAGGPDNPAGLLTGAAGAAVAHAARELGPDFAAELKATPNDPDGAFDRALKGTAIGSAFTAASFAAFGIAPFKPLADAVGLQAKVALKNLMFQALGVQPALTAAQKATENVMQGKPAGEGVAETIPGAIAMTAVPGLAHLGASTLAARGAPEAAPAPGGTSPPGGEGGPAPPGGGPPGGPGGPGGPPGGGAAVAPVVPSGGGGAPARSPEQMAIEELERIQHGAPTPEAPVPVAPTPPAPPAPPVPTPPPEPPPASAPRPEPPPAAEIPTVTVTAPRPPAPEAAPSGVTFRTAKGSEYAVNTDGTTTRNKSFHPEHGVADQGPQPTSETSFYVTPAEANALGEIQAKGAPAAVLAPLGDGRWGLRYTAGDNAGKFERRTVVTPQTTPAAGLVPVELWNGGARVHFGNEITEVNGLPAPAAPEPAPTAPAAPTRLRSIEQIQNEEGVGLAAAKRIQEEEILAIGKPITAEEAAARKAGVAAAPARAPPPAEPLAHPAEAPRAAAAGYTMFAPDELTIDPERFQYKAADEKGVTGALEGVERWEPGLANPITVFQGNDGNNYVVNGHQRTDLARRAQAAGQEDVQIPAKVYREADGYTPEEMRTLGALQNISEGSGTAIDAARVLRTLDSNTPSRVRLPDLPPRSALVRTAQGLKGLSDEAFGVVANGVVPEEYGQFVGAMIPDPAQQMAALEVLRRAEPANANQARLIVQDVRNSGFLEGSTADMFGSKEFAQSLLPERAKVLDRAMATLRKGRGLFRAAVEGEQTLTGAGNVLDREGNIAAKTANERLLDVLEKNATTRGPVSDVLTQAARDLAGGKPIASVASQFLAAIRRLDRGTEAEGLADDRAVDGRGAPPEGQGQLGELASPRRRFVPGQADIFGGPTPEAPAPRRQAEPTIRTDPRQQAMPGMEPSAVQAQASRDQAGPRGGQLPPDEGLFARPETPQTGLPLEPESKPTPEVLPSGHQVAANQVFDRGRESGHEHLALVDNATGQVIHESTSGKARNVSVPLKLLDRQPANSVTLHHNHPSSGSFSKEDLAIALHPAISHIVAVGHDGTTYTVRIDPAIKQRLAGMPLGDAQHALMKQVDDLRTQLRPVFQKMLAAKQLTYDQANQAYEDLTSRILHAEGVIDYVSGHALPAPVEAWFRDWLGRRPNGPLEHDRYTAAVGTPESLAGLPQRVEGQPGGAGAAGGERGDRVGGGEPPPEPPPREPPRQGRLLEEPPEFGDEDERRRPPPTMPRRPELDLTGGSDFDVLRDKKGFARFAGEIQSILAPASIRGATGAARTIREKGSQAQRAYDQSVRAVEAGRRNIDRLSPDQQDQITYNRETGAPQPTPEIQKVMDTLGDQLLQWARHVQSLGKGYLPDLIENYMRHMYSNYGEWSRGRDTEGRTMEEARAAGAGKSPLRGSMDFLKRRVFPTMKDAMDAGLEPITHNPIDLQLLGIREMQKLYYGTRMADEMKTRNIARWVPAGAESKARSAGLVPLDDQVFRPRLPGGEHGAFGRIEPGNWYAPEPAALLFNNYMSEGLSGRSVVYDTFRKAGNALNLMQLGLSGFHATFVTLDTMTSTVALGLQQIARGDIGRGAANVLLGVTPLAAVKAVRQGSQVRSAWLDPLGADPRWQKVANLLNTGGGQINMPEFYRSNASGGFFKSWADVKDPRSVFWQAKQMWNDHTPMGRAVMLPLELAGRTLESISEPLMGQMVPRAKAGVFAALAEDWQRAHPDATAEQRADAMIRFQNSVDNRLGQLRYDNLFWNKTMKDLAFITTRSVGWNIGTLRELGGGVMDSAKFVTNVARGKAPQFTTRMAYSMAMPAITALYGAVLTYLATGQGPQSTMDYFFPPSGGQDQKTGEPNRRIIPGYMKDVIEWSKQPTQTAINKANPLIETLIELRQNRDYYGGSIYDPKRDRGPAQAYADYLLNQSIPFAIRGAMKLHDQHAPMLDQMLSFWGIQPAPKSITQPEIGEAYQARQDATAYKRRLREGATGRIDFFNPPGAGAAP